MRVRRVNGQRLRELRRQRGLSCQALAQAARVTREGVRFLEVGKTLRPREVTVMAIAEALGVDPTEFAEFDDDERVAS